MQRSIKLIASGMLVAALLSPLYADAVGTSFGGRVIAAVPCMSTLGPALWFTIVPASLYPITTYIWTTATITYLAGPPRNPGQEVLGVADTPFVCTVGVGPAAVPLTGQRVQFIGTSAAF